MDRVQIQLPPQLRKDIQAIADYHEWSFAETMRRAAEKFCDFRQSALLARGGAWQLPEPEDMGFKPQSFAAYQSIIDQDRDQL
ncbi:MAG: hypothetical protein ACPGRX_04445 [Bdellovibrionales bacterium]